MKTLANGILGFGLLAGLLFWGIPRVGSGHQMGEEDVVRLSQRAGASNGGGLLISFPETTEVSGESLVFEKTESQLLTPQERDGLFKRLPFFEEAPNIEPFQKRLESRPAPRPGETLPQTFPPPDQSQNLSPVQEPQGPLEVLRFAPEGKVPVAAAISVTFSQPMIPLGSHEDVQDLPLPIQMEPRIPGSWRWAGTQTLIFDRKEGLPMATRYRVTVPSGTKSLAGNALEQDLSWEFETPPISVSSINPGPNSVLNLEPVFWIVFDQPMDSRAMKSFVSLTMEGATVPLSFLNEKELADELRRNLEKLAKDDDSFKSSLERLEKDGVLAYCGLDQVPNRWLAFKSSQKLEPAKKLNVSIKKGAPSKEGPLVSQESKTFSFKTYEALAVKRTSWERRSPQPNQPLAISFNNQLDSSAFKTEWVTLEPTVEDLKIEAAYQTITLAGRFRAKTKYRITIQPGLKDIYGQVLTKAITLEVTTSEYYPILSWGIQQFHLSDPFLNGNVDWMAVNLPVAKIQIRRVQPSDWGKYAVTMDRWRAGNSPVPPLGELLFEDTIRFDDSARLMPQLHVLEIAKHLKDKPGQVLVQIEADLDEAAKKANGSYEPRLVSWIQRTQLGLTALADSSNLRVWVYDLKTGQALPETQLELRRTKDASLVGTAVADAEGLGRFTLPTNSQNDLFYVVARRGEDVAFLPESTSGSEYDRRWHFAEPGPYTASYTTDGRGLYKPGEKVQVKGWVRLLHPKKAGQPQLLKPMTLVYRVTDSRQSKIAEGTLEVSGLGGFDLEFDIPDDANLGYASVSLEEKRQPNQASNPTSTTIHHSFQIQEFRRPEYEVSMLVPPGPHRIGNRVDAEVSAQYYAGGGLADAPVRWTVTSQRASYAPPGWPDYSFGTWIPWWDSFRSHTSGNTYTQESTTDPNGKSVLVMDLELAELDLPYTCQVNAAVRDVNAQEWQANAGFLVHPASLYVGLKTGRYFVSKGQPFAVEAIVTDIDGKVQPGQQIEIEVVRREWSARKGYQDVPVLKQSLTSRDEALLFEFPTAEGGTYVVRARVVDSDDRSSFSEMTRWVTGGRAAQDSSGDLQSVTLIPNKEVYQPGDMAEILVQAPFQPAEGKAILQQFDIMEVYSLSFTDGAAVLKFPIRETHIPNIQVQVELVGSDLRLDDSGQPDESLPRKVSQASGQLSLSVPPNSRELDIQIQLSALAVRPGATPDVAIKVTDKDGKSVANAEVALIVVDEAILALSGFQLGDPLNLFYPSVQGPMNIVRLPELMRVDEVGDLGDYLLVGGAQSDRMMESKMMAPMAQMRSNMRGNEEADGAEAGAPVSIRKDFNPVAAFLPNLKTDGSGVVKTTLKLPDNLTRYRVMAIAVTEKQFGTGEENLTARLPLMLRPSAPRFLNFGDSLELPFVVQNQTEEAMQVRLVIRAQNLAIQDVGGRVFEVPAGDRVEILIPATAESAGTARIQAAVFSGEDSDAAEISLPIWTPATSEAFATYGVIDSGATAQRVAPPSDVFGEFGGLEITTSSTALQGLTDAFLYLLDYPYGCSEQVGSQILAIAALRDVLEAFDGDIDPDRLEKTVNTGLTRLASLQNPDGGFGFWRRNERSWPFLTVHVGHALARAKVKGYQVPEQTLNRTLNYLSKIESYCDSEWSPSMRFSLSAYAIYVQRLAGKSVDGKAREVFTQMALDQAPIEGLGWLLPSLSQQDVARVLRLVGNRVSETAATAQITSRYGKQGYLILHADRRDDAVMLDALIEVAPDSDLIVKLVRGLMANRIQGRWRSTQENVFVLLAMDRYFQTYENQTPQFLAQVWLGNQFAGDQHFSGRETVRRQLDVPMDWLQNQGATDLVLTKEGEGRLYYRLGMRYAPRDLNLKPADHGFYVSRNYAALDDPNDVVVTEEGRVRVKRGARVKVTVNMVAPANRYHVALVDPLPAGFEPLNPSLKGNAPPAQGSTRPWFWSWFGHQNLRDERAEAFASIVYAGGYEYSYVARATTPGVFVVPPPKAEEMYFPETFGRGSTTWVEVY